MILFAGDPHGNYEHLYPFVKEKKNVALVILGDLQLISPHELDKLSEYCDIWFIHGNHDSKTVAAFDAIWGSEWKERNIHGKVVDFLLVYWQNWHYPVFNIADCFVCVGAALLVIDSIKHKKKAA